MSLDPLAEVRARHVKEGNTYGAAWCSFCQPDEEEGYWPCDATRLAALLTEERLAAALAVWHDGHRMFSPVYQKEAEVVLAALASQEAT